MLTRIGIENHRMLHQKPVHNGGPVERERGFVLHSTEYAAGSATLKVNKGFSMTATMDILEDIAQGIGPVRRGGPGVLWLGSGATGSRNARQRLAHADAGTRAGVFNR